MSDFSRDLGISNAHAYAIIKDYAKASEKMKKLVEKYLKIAPVWPEKINLDIEVDNPLGTKK